MKKIYLIFITLVVIVLWQMLLPGYVLSLDMVFTSEFRYIPDHSLPNSSGIFYLLMQGASSIMAGWLLQKIILAFLICNILYQAYAYFPVPKDWRVQLFAALVFLLNPFVYTRLLAGHWMFLLAYSFLPLFFHLLLKFGREINIKSSLRLFASLWLVSIFSLHLFLMLAIITGGFSLWLFYVSPRKKDLFASLGWGILFLAVVTSHWTVPMLKGGNTGISKFDAVHWTVFAPSGRTSVPVLLNLFSLNGFWGEGTQWAEYFHWPQDSAWFWVAFGGLIALTAFGVAKNYKRKLIWGLGALGVFAFVAATGATDTIFQLLNILAYRYLPFWTGFRDSQKFIGLLAAVYAVLAAYGFHYLIRKFSQGNSATGWKFARRYFPYVLLILPFVFGYYMLGGWHGQLKPVWYPDSWQSVKTAVDKPEVGRVLVLPWHGYLSLNFNRNLIVANPTRSYFGEKTLISRSVELKTLYDQETDPEYLKLDGLIRGSTSAKTQEMYDLFKSLNVTHILQLHDLNMTDSIAYRFLTTDRLSKVSHSDGITLYKIEKYD